MKQVHQEDEVKEDLMQSRVYTVLGEHAHVYDRLLKVVVRDLAVF